ncbi:histidine kinase [Burkholderiaceae bacterium DAT-1]|nr:histidine kinase [Burkholderiaceae bacterium DAT-1]
MNQGPMWRAFLTTFLIGCANYWLLHQFSARTAPSNMPRVVVSVLGGALLGSMLNIALNFEPFRDFLHLLPQFPIRYLHLPMQDLLRKVFNIFAVMLSISSLISTMLWAREHANRVEANYEQEKTKTALQEKQLIQSQLNMLQAQIEPHFLFNTLANLHSLIDLSPDDAKAMLAHLNGYLRASLTRTRHHQGTIKQEMELLNAYLGIQKIRMHERLTYTLNCPDELNQHPLAPMLIQPLVENAIKHGIEPKVEGGHILVDATVRGNQIVIAVQDNGMGFGQSAGGNGVALQNIRERLATLYAGQARMQLAENQNGGITASISIPLSNEPLRT